jgi:hypothetical protein
MPDVVIGLVSRVACHLRLGRRSAADQLDQPESQQQQDGDHNDDGDGQAHDQDRAVHP